MKQLAVILLVAACGGSSDLDADVVTNLPPGDATGSAMTGEYRIEGVTTDCSGDCRTTVDELVYSACDIGTRVDDTIAVTQTNGTLQIDVVDNDYVSRLTGGIDANGAFDVGGLRTQFGGEVTITARSQGTFGGASMTGIGRLRVGGRGLDCSIETEVTGTRR